MIGFLLGGTERLHKLKPGFTEAIGLRGGASKLSRRKYCWKGYRLNHSTHFQLLRGQESYKRFLLRFKAVKALPRYWSTLPSISSTHSPERRKFVHYHPSRHESSSEHTHQECQKPSICSIQFWLFGNLYILHARKAACFLPKIF